MPAVRLALAKPLLLSLGLAAPALAQVPLKPGAPAADTTRKYESPARTRPFFQKKLVRALLVPTMLIGYGAYTFNGGGFYTNQEAQRDLHRVFPAGHSSVADYLAFAPYLELGAVALAGIPTRNDRVNLLLLIAKSEVLMLASTYAVKQLSHEQRPDGSDYLSFPSGHTAQAFLAASIVHTELRDQSQLYGIGAYAVATSVGVLRMVNDKHWQSDVVAGAGFGILSAHLTYLTHRHRWGRHPIGRDVSIVPTFYGSAPGLTLTWRPR